MKRYKQITLHLDPERDANIIRWIQIRAQGNTTAYLIKLVEQDRKRAIRAMTGNKEVKGNE